LAGSALVGCRGANDVHYLGQADLQHYRNSALAIEYPNVSDELTQEVIYSQRPRTVKDREHDEAWDMSLLEALHTALANNKMIRTLGTQAQLLANPTTAPSVYDPALRSTGFLFGNRGVEAALADFDAQFSTSMIWGRDEQVVNSLATPGFVNTRETGVFTSQISKLFATGGSFNVAHNWNYLGSNTPGLLFPSAYTGIAQATFTQPLWAGGGVEYTRIAAPARAGLGGVTGVSQGVSIARINEDISLADFENSVINMAKDVEDLYWDLYLAYRQYDADAKNRDSAYETWRRVRAFMEAGAEGGGAGEEAQARENYFDVRARMETSLSNIFTIENQLRKLLGLPVNDGRVIRPSDDPVRAEYVVNWETSLAESLNKRVELRRQKWQIKSLELQVLAARNVCNPTLNFVSDYHINGFGDKLLSQQSADGITAAGYNSAYSTMTRGDLTGWTMGLQVAVPVGLRAARAQLHNTELQLTKARAALAAQELDISHDLADAMQKIDVAFMTARTNFDRRVASELRVSTEEAKLAVSVQGASVDLVLRAQASKAASEIAYFTSLVNYNKAIADLNLRRGTLLEVDSVSLLEEAWTDEAQDFALRRAWARSFAKPNEHLDTQPEEFASPAPYWNNMIPGATIEPGSPTPVDGLPPAAAPYEAPPANVPPPPPVPPPIPE